MTDTPNRPPLSLAAQAVLTAASVAKDYARCPIAAALRAAVEVVDFDPWLQEHVDYQAKLLAIAAELEGHQ